MSPLSCLLHTFYSFTPLPPEKPTESITEKTVRIFQLSEAAEV